MTPTHATNQGNPQKLIERRRLLAERGALGPERRAEASERIARRVLRLVDYPPRPIATVALYASFGHEVATHELIARLLERRLRVALPYIVHHPRLLEMREIDRFPQGLKRGDFGILEPEPIRHPAVLTPEQIDLVIVPGVGFDRRGHRLGYGAGFYDRWLQGEHRFLAVGLGFEAQILAAVPTDPWDRRMDGVITEAGVFGDLGKSGG